MAAINNKVRSDHEEGKNQKTSQWRRQLLVFSILVLVLTPLILLMSNLNAHQQFCFRIIMGLGAASVAALIPGFLKMQTTWLRNTFQASGAMAVFLVVYSLNPPPINTFVSLQELTGDWEYDCTISQGTFSHGGIQHGGVANFQIVRTKFGDALSINGTREWTRKDLESNRMPVEGTSVWQTQGANFVADDKLMYQYTTTEAGATFLGTTTLKVVRDDAGHVTLVGSFQRGPGAQNTYGTVVMRRKPTTAIVSNLPKPLPCPQPSPVQRN